MINARWYDSGISQGYPRKIVVRKLQDMLTRCSIYIAGTPNLMTRVNIHQTTASADIYFSLINFRLAALLGWQDVAQRYRRSSLGAFWLTINMGVLIVVLGFVFGMILKTPMTEFLPFLCLGLIFWSYFSQNVNDGCSGFIVNSETILQLPIPFFTYILRAWWRNTIVLAHNVIIVPFVFLYFMRLPTLDTFFFIPGFILVTVNLLWVMMVLAILCTRYRDLTQIIQNAIQILLYLTPIMWMPSHLPTGASELILTFNPIFHLLSLVREPLLGHMPTVLNWLVAIGLAIAGWFFTLLFLNRFRSRVAYWL
jgi:lipopolysaccharide transport system permease protein